MRAKSVQISTCLVSQAKECKSRASWLQVLDSFCPDASRNQSFDQQRKEQRNWRLGRKANQEDSIRYETRKCKSHVDIWTDMIIILFGLVEGSLFAQLLKLWQIPKRTLHQHGFRLFFIRI